MSIRPHSNPSGQIPNAPFSSNDLPTLKGPYWDVPLGGGLTLDSTGNAIESAGGSPLPEHFPPYYCNTDVNTSKVTDFTDAWRGCYNITEFPQLDTSSGVNFTYSWAYTGLTTFPQIDTGNGLTFDGAWAGCYYMTEFPQLDLSNGKTFMTTWYDNDFTSFPTLDLSSGEVFRSAWEGCSSLTSFPPLKVSSGVDFRGAWFDCSSLTSFPTLDFSSGEDYVNAWCLCSSLTSFPPLNFSSGLNFERSWRDCSSLVSFPSSMFNSCLATNFQYAWQGCALSEESVDNILTSLDTAGQSNGTVNLDGGTSAAPSATGLAAKASLQAKGWTVTTN